MAVHRERRWPRIAAGYAALLVVTGALTAFLYDTAAPDNRADVIRYAAAFLVAVIMIHLRSYFRGDPRWEPPSQFIDALAKGPPAVKLDPGFAKLRDEVANSLASWSYFEKAFWPRVRALARARGASGDLPFPGERGWWGRGPSAPKVTALVDRIDAGGSRDEHRRGRSPLPRDPRRAVPDHRRQGRRAATGAGWHSRQWPRPDRGLPRPCQNPDCATAE